MSREQVRSVLRGRYLEDISANVDASDARYLRRVAEAGTSGSYTQATLEKLWKVSRGTVSKVLKRLEAAGYVAEREPGEPVGRGRPEKGYELTAVPRLAYEPALE
jgi:Fic family protein